MANQNMDYLFPEFWTNMFDGMDMGEYGLQNMVSRDTQKLIADKGDTVTVPLTPDLGTADDWTPGDALTATDINQERVQVILNKSKRKTILLTGAEFTKSNYTTEQMIEAYAKPAVKTLIKAVNKDIYLELLKTPYFVDAITNNVDEDYIVDARNKLDTNEVQLENRFLVSGTDGISSMLKLDAFQHYNISGSTSVIEKGDLGMKFGFQIKQNNIISKYTPADLTGAINAGAGYAAGVTTIVVDGFNDDVNPVRVGDMFTIAGESGTPYHTVTSTLVTSSDTTSITFTPALTGSVADNDVVTITPTQSILAFVPGAVGLAARAYSVLPDGTGVRQNIGNYMGLPIRVSIFHDGLLGFKAQFDILYGVALYKSTRVCRILTA